MSAMVLMLGWGLVNIRKIRIMRDENSPDWSLSYDLSDWLRLRQNFAMKTTRNDLLRIIIIINNNNNDNDNDNDNINDDKEPVREI